jgi:hypothetical protein
MANFTMANITTLRDLVDFRNEVLYGRSIGPNPTLNNPSTALTPTSPSPEPPLAFLDMPRNNVFLKHRKPSTPGFRDQWTDEQYQQAAIIAAQQDAINQNMFDETDALRTAATSHFRDRYYSARVNFDCKRMMEILIFRYGSVPPNKVKMLIDMMPKGLVNSGNENAFHKKLIAHQTQAKANTKSFLSLSMKQLLVEVPGFRNATREARISLLVRMFNQSKIVISENLFYVEAQSVGIPSIFRSDDDDRRPWQNFLRTRFVNLAMNTYDILVLEENDPQGAEKELRD